jgi:8-oxo-dGTP pyrophosphatase MutT (NUDIX family)
VSVSRAPRPASTICVFRDGAEGAEVLMVQRGETARFMGGAWVFPGGTVDELDRGPAAAEVCSGSVDEEMRPWMAAAVRELVEETQVWLTDPPVTRHDLEPFLKDAEVYAYASERRRRFDLDRLGYFANWITPTVVPMRFDTRFFAAAVSPATEANPDPSELNRAEWVRPEDALARSVDGSWVVPFPTAKTLETFVGVASAAAVMDHVGSLGAVPPVQPRMRVGEDGLLEVVMPGEAGFDDLGDEGPDHVELERAARASAAEGDHLPELEVRQEGAEDAG